MAYQKQLSKTAARIMAFCVSGMFIGAAVGFALPMVFFGPIILVMCCLIFFFGTLGYVFKGELSLPDGSDGMFAGWAVAAVCALPIVVATHFIMWLHGHASRRFAAVPEIEPGELFILIAGALLGIVTLGMCVAYFVSEYVLTPEECYTQGRDELDEKSAAMGSLYFSLGAMMLVLCVSAPTGTILMATYLRSYHHRWQRCAQLEKQLKTYRDAGGKEKGWDEPICSLHRGPYAPGKMTSTCSAGSTMHTVGRVFFSLACFPAALLGFGAVRRGLWMLSIKRMVENVATSKVRGAAMGLIELHGKAVPVADEDEEEILACRSGPMAGRQAKVQPFCLEDETGRVRIEVPEDCIPGEDPRIALTKHSRVEGSMRAHSLCAGDDVYVIGELTTQREGGESTDFVRSWELPYGRFMLGYLNALFRRPWTMTGVIKFNRILRFGFLPHIFLVCDGDEKMAKAAMFRGWKRQVTIGVVMFLSALGLWSYLDWVLPR